MKVLLQRVKHAAVDVACERVAEIGQGLLAFVGVEPADTEVQADWLADKTLGLRIFADNNKPMNLSVQDVVGEILVVSQFTLAADTSKGKRPSFTTAAQPEQAQALYEYFVARLRKQISVQTGEFGADMAVTLTNDGPVTFVLER
jgi:D-tyrosyl-tRNA(Tyr) deacylase